MISKKIVWHSKSLKVIYSNVFFISYKYERYYMDVKNMPLKRISCWKIRPIIVQSKWRDIRMKQRHMINGVDIRYKEYFFKFLPSYNLNGFSVNRKNILIKYIINS